MVEQQRIGRGRQTLPVLTPHQWAVAVISGVVFGVLLLWHLTLVITASLAVFYALPFASSVGPEG